MASRWLLAEPVLVLDSNMSEVVAVTPTGGPTRQESVTHIKRHKLASCNVPLVHGRPNPSISPRSRLTTHQRNHSLDFRYPFRSYEYSARSFRDTRASYLRRVWRAASNVSWHLLNKSDRKFASHMPPTPRHQSWRYEWKLRRKSEEYKPEIFKLTAAATASSILIIIATSNRNHARPRYLFSSLVALSQLPTGNWS